MGQSRYNVDTGSSEYHLITDTVRFKDIALKFVENEDRKKCFNFDENDSETR